VFTLLAASRLPLQRALVVGLIAGLAFAVPAALTFGMLNGLASGLQPSEYVARPGPGEAIARSKRNGIVSGLSFGLVIALAFGLVIWLVVWLASGLAVGLTEGRLFVPTDLIAAGYLGPIKIVVVVGLVAGVVLGLPAGLIMGLVIGLHRGGGAYLRHLLTRRLLVMDGATPRDYVGFLEYARRLGLLRIQGGGFQFIHPLVQQYFASASAPLQQLSPT
jgi:hypothetical protein